MQRPLGTKMPKTMPSKKRFPPQAGARKKIETVSPKEKDRKTNEKVQTQIIKIEKIVKVYKVKWTVTLWVVPPVCFYTGLQFNQMKNQF